MTIDDILAFLELAENFGQDRSHVEEVCRSSTEQFASILYGSGGWSRYAVYKRPNNRYEIRLLYWSVESRMGLKAFLDTVRSLGVSIQGGPN